MPSSLTSPIYTDVRYFLGDAQVPREIKNQRNYTMEAMRRMGTPVLLKRMYTSEDVDQGNAQQSPFMDSVYKQSRQNDPVSYGTGFVSLDTQPGEWYDTATQKFAITDPHSTAPTPTSVPAPRYRGYGPGFLTYVILPDRPEDVFKITPQGVMTQIQQAKVQLPWWPIMGDNDLLITVSLDNGGNIVQAYERYLLKQVMPITMRGMDRSGRREVSSPNAGGNRYWVGQECEANKIPLFDPLYGVEIDR